MAFWINAKDIPFKGLKLYPESVLSLPSQGISRKDIKEFFFHLEKRVSAGFYAFGFLAYELGYLLEPKLEGLFWEPNSPLAYFVLGRKIEEVEIWPEDLSLREKEPFLLEDLHFNLSLSQYQSALEKIKAYIASGDTYQVNFTGKFRFSFFGNPLDLFKILLFSQRCEYSAFLEEEDFLVLSLSPELFLEKKGTHLRSSPMKGTAKRAIDYFRDRKIKERFRRGLKNRAENLMILDLLRNDLGRVCEAGSVRVEEYLKIKTYPTLHQMVSTVGGKLKEGIKLFSIVESLFPCGSVTGAPKIRTMEIIRELENEPRGVYTGAFGIIFPSGDFIFNVSIRTLFLKRKPNYYQGELGVGAGIVWDSDPKREYEETLLKAAFITSPIYPFYLIETFNYPEEEEKLILHFQRLKNSAKYFAFPFSFKDFSGFKNFIEKNLPQEGDEGRRVRLILYPSGKVEVEFHPKKSWPSMLKVLCKRRKTKKTLFHFHKTSRREEYDREFKEALAQGFSEVIFYDEEGRVLEGAISNFFAERQKELITPPLELGILPGVLRKILLDKGQAKEGLIKLEDLSTFSALYVGNSARGLGKISKWFIV